MKRKHIFYFVVYMGFAAGLNAQVVNYKQLKVPTVDAGGKIRDASGNLLGSLDRDDIIYDASDVKIGHVDAFGNAVDDATASNYGKCDSEGNFMVVANKKLISWKSFHPESPGIQLCLIKDKNDKVVATVHKSYKQHGTAALYYLLTKFAPTAAEKTSANTQKSPNKKNVTSTKKKKSNK